MKIVLLFCSLFITAFFACTGDTTAPNNSPAGTYSFDAVDAQGAPAAAGTLSLVQSDTVLTGEWHFTDGRTGTIEGSYINGSIRLDLFPGFVDNNFFLTGMLSANTIHGTWEQIGFPGVMASGSFTATRK